MIYLHSIQERIFSAVGGAVVSWGNTESKTKAKERLSTSVAKEIDETDALKAKAREKATKATEKKILYIQAVH